MCALIAQSLIVQSGSEDRCPSRPLRRRRPPPTCPPKRRRLTAEARKNSILDAARRAFIETGDMNGTTIKVIAEHSGISEGVIYRHFESKDQLFFEAVVEPAHSGGGRSRRRDRGH